jgi:hypothetical protein
MEPEAIPVHLRVTSIIRTLYYVAAALVVLDLCGLAIALITGHDSIYGLLGIIDLDKERGIGVLFQVFLMLGNVAMLALLGKLARAGKADPGPWYFMAGLFTFLTMDEFSYIHEQLMDPMRELVGSEGILHFAWVVPYGIAVVLLGLWFAPKVWAIRPGPRKWFFLAAVTYVTGALGFEMLGGWRLTVIGGEAYRPEMIYELLTTVEEGLEMVGLTMLATGVLQLLQPAIKSVALKLDP